MNNHVVTVTAFSLLLLCVSAAKAHESQGDSLEDARAFKEVIQQKKSMRVELLSSAVESNDVNRIKEAVRELTPNQIIELLMTPNQKNKCAIEKVIEPWTNVSKRTLQKYSDWSLDLRLSYDKDLLNSW